MNEAERTAKDIRDLDIRMSATVSHAYLFCKPIIGMELEFAQSLVKDAIKCLERQSINGLNKN